MPTKFIPMRARMKYIHERLEAVLRHPHRPLPNAESLARDYEDETDVRVSSRTIRRDIDFMKNEDHAPIEFDARRNGYHYTDPNYRFETVSLNQDELFGLHMARMALRQYADIPMYKQFLEAFDRLTLEIPARAGMNPAWFNDRIRFIGMPIRPVNAEIWDTLARALHARKALVISYAKPSTMPPEKRVVHPYGLVNYHGDWYLIGECEARKDVRIFGISRIRLARQLTRGYDIPATFSLETYFDRHFGIIHDNGKPVEIRIRFCRHSAHYAKERTWGAAQKCTRNPDGTMDLVFEAVPTLEVIAWILGWGDQATVLEPASLVASVRQQLSAALACYTTTSPG